ncbi:hypothetical protein HYW75_06180 [Candidatus Pacearchaeota archaeon]|nr:hypothetical protein [Candidatus Pacearchaeota archaeon]
MRKIKSIIRDYLLSATLTLSALSFTSCSHLPFSHRDPITLIYEGEIDGNNVRYYEKRFDNTGYSRLDILDKKGKPMEIMIDGFEPQNSGDEQIDYYSKLNDVYTENYVIKNRNTISGKGPLSIEILEQSKAKLSEASAKYQSLLKKIKEKIR